MPDEQNTNDSTDQVEETPAEQEAPQGASQEESPQETRAEEQEVPQETTDEPSEDINIDEFSRERYQQPPQQPANGTDGIAQELAQLPTDDYGNVSTEAAAKWFSDKLSSVSSQAEERAVARAQEVVMSNLSEVSQQRQLLDKYPELRKDRERLDAVFDLRDASALRGKNLTLVESAARLSKLQQRSSKDAARTTETVAAAHLETASTKGNPVSGQDQLAAQAFQGTGPEAKQARRELLNQFVTKEIAEGRIQHP